MNDVVHYVYTLKVYVLCKHAFFFSVHVLRCIYGACVLYAVVWRIAEFEEHRK